MTPAELIEEKRYRTQERLGILSQGAPATAAELELAVRETDAFLADLEREELTQRIFALSKTNNRDYHLKKRFGGAR